MKPRVVSAVAAAVLIAIGFLAIQFLQPSPRFLAGFPEALAEGRPVLKGPKDRPVYVAKLHGRVFSFDSSCPPPAVGEAGGPACRLEWDTAQNHFACTCGPSARYDAEGHSIEPGRPSLHRLRTTLSPGGQIMVDRSVTFAEKDWLKPGAELFLVPPVQSAGGM